MPVYAYARSPTACPGTTSQIIAFICAQRSKAVSFSRPPNTLPFLSRDSTRILPASNRTSESSPHLSYTHSYGGAAGYLQAAVRSGLTLNKFRSEQRPAAPLKAQRGQRGTALLLGRGATESKAEGKEQSGSKPSSSGSDGCLPPAPLSTTAPPSFFFPSRQSSGRQTGHHRDVEQSGRVLPPPPAPSPPAGTEPPPTPRADRCGRPPLRSRRSARRQARLGLAREGRGGERRQREDRRPSASQRGSGVNGL